MALRDIGAGGGVGIAFGAVADLLVTGGDMVMLLVDLGIDLGPLLYLLLSRLLAAAPQISFLPENSIRTAFTAISLFLALGALYRIVKRLAARFGGNDETA